jgi:hypothetical protein
MLLPWAHALLSFSLSTSGLYWTRAAAIFSNIPVNVSHCRAWQKAGFDAGFCVPIWLEFDMSSSTSGPWLVISGMQLSDLNVGGHACNPIMVTATGTAVWAGWLEAPVISQ